jgi:tRNA-2-methylthio-N6-dimethylallyladenosine synthase
MLSGYTEESKLVHFQGSSDLVGTIVEVKILESRVYHLNGELIGG